MTEASLADCLISARLLMLQSKRLILATLERRLTEQRRESLRPRVDRLREETQDAQERYTSSILRWGCPTGRSTGRRPTEASSRPRTGWRRNCDAQLFSSPRRSATSCRPRWR